VMSNGAQRESTNHDQAIELILYRFRRRRSGTASDRVFLDHGSEDIAPLEGITRWEFGRTKSDDAGTTISRKKTKTDHSSFVDGRSHISTVRAQSLDGVTGARVPHFLALNRKLCRFRNKLAFLYHSIGSLIVK
jgi:hypothetical protein